MPYLIEGLSLLVVLTVVLILAIASRPAMTAGRAGRVLAFVAFCVLPIVVTAVGVGAHLEHSKSTEFCLSCHVMGPYGESLYFEDESHVAALHFQNRWIPPERACFTCHTTYTMFGDLRAKMQGLKHVYVYYLGKVPEQLELYEPYNNRECLSCHGGARRFEASELHLEVRDELSSGDTSCMDCHEPIHDIDGLAAAARWSPEARQ